MASHMELLQIRCAKNFLSQNFFITIAVKKIQNSTLITFFPNSVLQVGQLPPRYQILHQVREPHLAGYPVLGVYRGQIPQYILHGIYLVGGVDVGAEEFPGNVVDQSVGQREVFKESVQVGGVIAQDALLVEDGCPVRHVVVGLDKDQALIEAGTK